MDESTASLHGMKTATGMTGSKRTWLLLHAQGCLTRKGANGSVTRLNADKLFGGHRTTAHGLSAGFAKCGALWATVWFNYLPNAKRFWATATFNIAGAIITVIFLPDPIHVSLTELDRRFRCACQNPPATSNTD